MGRLTPESANKFNQWILRKIRSCSPQQDLAVCIDCRSTCMRTYSCLDQMECNMFIATYACAPRVRTQMRSYLCEAVVAFANGGPQRGGVTPSNMVSNMVAQAVYDSSHCVLDLSEVGCSFICYSGQARMHVWPSSIGRISFDRLSFTANLV